MSRACGICSTPRLIDSVAGVSGILDETVIARSTCDEAIHVAPQRKSGLLRGACHRAALRADPLARNDEHKKGDPMSRPANPVTLPLAEYSPKHFLLAVAGNVATVTLNRPERKNPLTFESYRELTDFFRACAMDDQVKTIVVSGAGGNFSSGGDVFEIIGPFFFWSRFRYIERVRRFKV